MKYKRSQYIELSPKNPEAIKRLGYHGTKWLFVEEVAKLKYIPGVGPWLVLRSRDGTKMLFVHKLEDKYFTILTP